jgi:hypothetical protein
MRERERERERQRERECEPWRYCHQEEGVCMFKKKEIATQK